LNQKSLSRNLSSCEVDVLLRARLRYAERMRLKLLQIKGRSASVGDNQIVLEKQSFPNPVLRRNFPVVTTTVLTTVPVVLTVLYLSGILCNVKHPFYHDENTAFHDYMQNNTRISPEYF
jgi:hypothetical protein